MQAVPAGWKRRVASNHEFDVRLTLCQAGDPLTLLPRAGRSGASASQASLGADSTAQVNRTASVSLVLPPAAANLLPGNSDDLTPAGFEVKVEYGIDGGLPGSDPDGFYYLTVGMLPIITAQANDSVSTSGSSSGVGPVVNLTLDDRGQVINACKTREVITYRAGTRLENAVYDLIHRCCPWIPDRDYQLGSSGAVLPLTTLDVGTAALSTARGWAQGVGWKVEVGPAGKIVLANAVPPLAPVAVWQPGPSMTLAATNAVWDASSACNGVVVQGNHPSGDPVQGFAWDEDSASPTYATNEPGGFGYRLASPISAPTALSVLQAKAAAAAQLPTYLGLTRTVEATLIPDASWDLGDVVQVVDVRAAVNGLWQVQSFSLPLDDTQQSSVVLVPIGRSVKGRFARAKRW